MGEIPDKTAVKIQCGEHVPARAVCLKTLAVKPPSLVASRREDFPESVEIGNCRSDSAGIKFLSGSPKKVGFGTYSAGGIRGCGIRKNVGWRCYWQRSCYNSRRYRWCRWGNGRLCRLDRRPGNRGGGRWRLCDRWHHRWRHRRCRLWRNGRCRNGGRFLPSSP